ncbi:trypsin-3 isoform X1 [Drosophila willistoni]|uniref:trypsin-3 isoform X1 n=1 Tax=Drosophila willistoni TaxID=7260 RepID=UPI000C26D8B1|nr:trypsin-3 isoform X1 [Drosophila willistoni]
MYSSKFIVSILILAQFSLNTISGQWNNENTDNRIDGTAYDNNDVDKGTDASLEKLLSLNYRTLDRRQGKQNATEDDEFEFLIAGGYRPKTNLLVQFMVSLRTEKQFGYFGDNHYCAGSIISKKVILTAAHCLIMGEKIMEPNEITVVAGIQRRLLKTAHTQILAVEKVIVHSKFSLKNKLPENDIGILKLKDEITINEGFVNIIPMADSEPIIGTKCTALGWGKITQYGPPPDEVLSADLIITEVEEDKSACSSGLVCAWHENDLEISGCEGDSGGPLFCNNKLVGVLSAGVSCGQTRTPIFFSDVYYYRKWIENAAVSIRRSSSMVTIDKLMLLLLAIIKLAITL